MTFQTEGILLQRKPIKELDESLTFFTEKCGKITCFSYGTKSPRSQRAKVLTSLQWLTLHVKKQHHHHTLTHIEPHLPIAVGNTDMFYFLQEALRVIARKLPSHVQDEEVYHLLKILTHVLKRKQPISYQKFMFYYGLLHVLGEFPTCDVECSPKSLEADRTQPVTFTYALPDRTYKHLPNQKSSHASMLPTLSLVSLCFLKQFEKHFSLTVQFYDTMHGLLLAWKEKQYQVDLGGLVGMGKALVALI